MGELIVYRDASRAIEIDGMEAEVRRVVDDREPDCG